MDLKEIQQHWKNWAREYGTNFRATTKASATKNIEIDVLTRALQKIILDRGEHLNILEVGCGNGQNLLSLIDCFPNCTFLGIDYIEEMIESANRQKITRSISDNLKFQVGDLLDLALPKMSYDVIFTVRCLINLNSDLLQKQAILSLVERLKPEGYLFMLENTQESFSMQNQIRNMVDLPARSPSEFNHFLNEKEILDFLPSVGLELIGIEDFISFYDLILYVLLPMVNGGVIDYDNPLVQAASRLNMMLSKHSPNGLGAYGQNRFFKCRKINIL